MKTVTFGRSNPKLISVYNIDGAVVMLRNKFYSVFNGSAVIAVFKIKYR